MHLLHNEPDPLRYLHPRADQLPDLVQHVLAAAALAAAAFALTPAALAAAALTLAAAALALTTAPPLHRDVRPRCYLGWLLRRRRPRRGALGLWVWRRLHRLRPPHLGSPCHRAAADLRQCLVWLFISMLRKS